MTFEFLDPAIKLLPEVKRPKVTQPFKKKIMWVVVGLLIFFILGEITPYGALSQDYCQIDANKGLSECQRVGFLRNMQTILASNIGSLATLGIGPIVMASIILQLLSGADLIHVEKERYQGVQKLFAVLFCFFEGAIYVATGFLPIEPSGVLLLPIPALASLLELNAVMVLFQIAMGSIILLYLDEVISKWGFGSGIGLFIVAGVSQTIIYRSVSFDPRTGMLIGAIPNALSEFIGGSTPVIMLDILAPVLFTIIVFLIVVYVEAMRVEIPLTLGRVRGIGGRYPLKFLYSSNLPVILAAAMFANVMLVANVADGMDFPVLGEFREGQPVHNMTFSTEPFKVVIPLAYMVKAPYGVMGTTTDFHSNFIEPSYTAFELIPLEPLKFIPLELVHMLCYTILLMGACIVFGKFWIETTGMGAKQVAEQLRNVGFSVPGFRRDVRVMEKVLNKYIPVITVLGAAAVGLLAAGADLTGALGSGTGILLSVGILYRLYEELAQSQLMEMHPALKQFLSG